MGQIVRSQDLSLASSVLKFSTILERYWSRLIKLSVVCSIKMCKEMRLCQNKGLPEVHCLGKGVGPACQAVSRMREACHPHRGTPASVQTDLPSNSWSGLKSASASNSQALDQKRSTRLCKIHKLLLQSKRGSLFRVLNDFRKNKRKWF